MPDTSTAGALRERGRRALAAQQGGHLEADILLCHVLGVSRAWLYANGDRAVAPAEQARYEQLVEQRARGEPIAYLTGVREFWSLPFAVTPDVLIPRPETEGLVALGLDVVPDGKAARIADLGTGSGAIAIALASERPDAEIHATDVSAAALAVARRNAKALGQDRIVFHQGDWLAPLVGLFDLIVSNPPYIDAGDAHLGEGDCRFEPDVALTPGPEGMTAIEHIASEAFERLRPGGCLAFEHGFDQGEASRDLLAGKGYVRVETRLDLEGLERISLGYRPAEG